MSVNNTLGDENNIDEILTNIEKLQHTEQQLIRELDSSGLKFKKIVSISVLNVD